jgi:hypothetical protein
MLSERRMSPQPSCTSASMPPGPSLALRVARGGAVRGWGAGGARGAAQHARGRGVGMGQRPWARGEGSGSGSAPWPAAWPPRRVPSHPRHRGPVPAPALAQRMPAWGRLRSATGTAPAPSPRAVRRRPPLCLHHLVQPGAHVLGVQWREAELGAAGLERRDDLADVVADEAEPRVARVLLDDCGGEGGWGSVDDRGQISRRGRQRRRWPAGSTAASALDELPAWAWALIARSRRPWSSTPRRTSPQRKLRVLGHGVALIQDDQLELVAAATQGRAGLGSRRRRRRLDGQQRPSSSSGAPRQHQAGAALQGPSVTGPITEPIRARLHEGPEAARSRPAPRPPPPTPPPAPPEHAAR